VLPDHGIRGADMKLRSIHGILGAAALIAGIGLTTFATAGDPIGDRRALMKGVGGAAGVVGKMLKGEVPYDAAKAAEALGAMQTAGKAFSEQYAMLYPKGSDQGETGASMAVFDKADEFKAKSAAFAVDATAAIEATKKDEAAFKEAAGKVFGNCKSCHETFRKPM
jgi:cytochrome c556